MRKKKHKVYTRTKRRTIKTILESYSDENGKHKESSIEKKVRLYLESEGIPHIPEKFIEYKGKWKSYDFIVTDGLNYTFLIECDGNFWHDPNGQHKIQKKNIRNDKFKDKAAKHLGIPLLRFTETEINSDFEKIKEKIHNEITRQTFPTN